MLTVKLVSSLKINSVPSTAYNNGKFIANNRLFSSSSSEVDPRLSEPRVSDQADVVIVGGGPSGLSAAIRMKQLSKKAGKDFRVCLVEKGAEIGNHILSGAVIEPRALNELIPDWKEKGAPLNTPVTNDKFYWLLNDKQHVRLPTLREMNNHGNYIVSLANVTRWLGKQAEEEGVEIYSGIAASEVLYDEMGNVKGIATGDVGIGKDGKLTENFAKGMELHAKVTLFAEGCRGSLTKTLYDRFKLRDGVDPQTYGIGIKELWEVPKENHKLGSVMHTAGWPAEGNCWLGSWMYHMEDNKISLGMVCGLDYENTYLSPFKELQRFKHHPLISKILDGGKCIGYGARALNEGGLQSIPKLIFPGGALIGDTAGFLNVPKVKGTHTSMKSGMLAAEAAFDALSKSTSDDPLLLASYPENLKNSWVYKELHEVRNQRPAFSKFGAYAGSLYMGVDSYVMRGRVPWTFHMAHADNECLKPAKECKKIDYPKPDGKLSFDLMTDLTRSGTNHNEDQPAHLKLKDPSIWLPENLEKYDSPESRYCPAGVYEVVQNDEGKPKLQINAQNCLHCKTCDIKDPKQNIYYTVPEGGGGPGYGSM